LVFGGGEWNYYETSASPAKALSLCQEALACCAFFRAPENFLIPAPAFTIQWADGAELNCGLAGDQTQTAMLITGSFISPCPSDEKPNLWGYFSSPTLYQKLMDFAAECKSGQIASSSE
jgi:hypothetical protein